MPQSPRRCLLESAPSPQSAASEAMPPLRRQSAAEQTSHARYGVRAVETGIDSQKTRGEATHRTYTAQRVQPFKLQTRNVGGRGGRPSPFSGGSKGGILFGKRIPPLSGSSAKCCTNHAVPTALQPTHPSKRGAESLRPSGRKKRAVHRTTLIFCSISQCG